MKLISEHLGEIIVALVGIAVLVAAVTFFKADLGTFFKATVDALTSNAKAVVSAIPDAGAFIATAA